MQLKVLLSVLYFKVASLVDLSDILSLRMDIFESVQLAEIKRAINEIEVTFTGWGRREKREKVTVEQKLEFGIGRSFPISPGPILRCAFTYHPRFFSNPLGCIGTCESLLTSRYLYVCIHIQVCVYVSLVYGCVTEGDSLAKAHHGFLSISYSLISMKWVYFEKVVTCDFFKLRILTYFHALITNILVKISANFILMMKPMEILVFHIYFSKCRKF